ncbi:DNA repair protein RecN [Limnobacter litoralis]|uniref:DNA repair protein RecN n=1 Tax=Limnobacter litoralis TaxID=481366 RepID=A0ABQ5YTP3_9BURK|nr:DNA repair protein RecN [Limnobacter litoralis]GLR26666.1 DNA repair protein RecN [Limnobacter litoralis]
MLSSLTIQDFVIVDHLQLEFDSGMSVLSGETGAGKSILIDALSLTLGARSDASQVREGAEKATISAMFDLNEQAKAILEEQGLDTSEGELILRRVIESSGRSKAFVNGTPVPASTLKQLSETLIDIHGQHAFQTLTKPAEQRRMLDAYAQHDALLANVGSAYQALHKARRQLNSAREGQQEKEARLSALQWKLDALDKVAPKPGQWETLSQEHERLSHSAELLTGTQAALNTLSGDEHSMLDQLAEVLGSLTHLSQRDHTLADIVKNLGEGEILIREAAYDLGHYLKHSNLDPDSLADVDRQMSEWHDTARKLRVAPELLHEEWEQTRAEIESIETGFDLDQLEKQLHVAQMAYDSAALVLRNSRIEAASRLAKCVTDSMQTLSMQGGRFEVALNECEPSSFGSDDIEFKVAGHPGVTPQPIQKVASGGELARISLAITVNTVESTPVPTLIFDEVDSGIGGAVAETVGKYLRSLGEGKQVLCVTHLPQVAAQGHHHYQVSKTIDNGFTRSVIQKLGAESRITEVARMLGGQNITSATRTAAQEMINAG